MNKNNCTAETLGKIVRRWIVNAIHIEVEYIVGENRYSVKEQIRYNKAVYKKILFIPIGRKASAALGDTGVGAEVRVLYNPLNPSEAYLPDNEGKRY